MCRRNALNKTKQESKSKKVNTKKKRLTCLHLIKALQKIDINPKYVFHKKAHLSCPYFSFSWHLQKQQLKIQNMSVSQIARFARDQKFILSKTVKNKTTIKEIKQLDKTSFKLLFSRLALPKKIAQK